MDFREKVLSVMKNEGLSVRTTAKRFKMSKTTLMKWKLGIVPKTTRNKPKISVDMDALKRDIEEYSAAYLLNIGCGLISRFALIWLMALVGKTPSQKLIQLNQGAVYS